MHDSLKRASTFVLGLALGGAVGIAIGVHFSGRSTLVDTVASPDKTERLDYYSANRWQSLGHANVDMLGYVRLVRVAGNEIQGTSPVFELSGSGEVSWNRSSVAVGSGAVFDRAAARWSMEH